MNLTYTIPGTEEEVDVTTWGMYSQTDEHGSITTRIKFRLSNGEIHDTALMDTPNIAQSHVDNLNNYVRRSVAAKLNVPLNDITGDLALFTVQAQ